MSSSFLASVSDPYQVTPQLEPVPDVAPPLFSKLLSLRREYFPLPSYVRTRSGPNAGGVFAQTPNPASHLPILVEYSAPTPPIDVADSRTPTGQTYATDVSCISHGSTCDDVISRSRAALHLLKKGVCEFGVGGHRPPLGFEKGEAPTQVEEIRLFVLSFHCRFCVINSGCPHLSP